MGILNLTPDSFSDGGLAPDLDAAVSRAEQLVADGADLLDLGGESSRPGADPVPLEEEIRRVLPVVEALAGRIGVPLSIDTTKPEVAERALRAGASVINDIRGLSGDDRMPKIVAESGAAVVLMHMKGSPKTMQRNPTYADVVTEVYDELARLVERAEASGIERSRIAVDPGIGFGKTADHNWELLRRLGRLEGIGCSILVGTSRKRFLGDLTGRGVGDRAAASVASSLLAIEAGADIVRVHDVAAMADAVKVWSAIKHHD
ncbi:dihydropteroate synthase [Tautonia sociabilis]|uniref:Dihydropteroate synthase n=2 Tax=Tautonia sociabilis TaxID=2080755 RepID=A0A432MH20_9BACT|nr:dihydropteroate synthase [Tautonia sociabilis]